MARTSRSSSPARGGRGGGRGGRGLPPRHGGGNNHKPHFGGGGPPMRHRSSSADYHPAHNASNNSSSHNHSSHHAGPSAVGTGGGLHSSHPLSDPGVAYRTLCSANTEALPAGWERIEFNGCTIYLDHLNREAFEQPPWKVWAERAAASTTKS